jgi:hypothetical protein
VQPSITLAGDAKTAVFHRIHRCGELWCVIYSPSKRAHVTRGAKRKQKRQLTEGASVRATISFPSELYKTLEGIAREKKVSLAWVVREAGEQYIADKWPLFGKNITRGEK